MKYRCDLVGDEGGMLSKTDYFARAIVGILYQKVLINMSSPPKKFSTDPHSGAVRAATICARSSRNRREW